MFVRPNVVLDRDTKGVWNWARILSRPDRHDEEAAQRARRNPRVGDWIRATDVKIVNGRFLIVSPWAPAPNLKGVAADSAVREAVSGRARVFVERGARRPAPAHRDRLINGISRCFCICQPGQPSSVAEVATLAMNAYFVRPPGGDSETCTARSRSTPTRSGGRARPRPSPGAPRLPAAAASCSARAT